jgi:hypothetical protein
MDWEAKQSRISAQRRPEDEDQFGIEGEMGARNVGHLPKLGDEKWKMNPNVAPAEDSVFAGDPASFGRQQSDEMQSDETQQQRDRE